MPALVFAVAWLGVLAVGTVVAEAIRRKLGGPTRRWVGPFPDPTHDDDDLR